MKSITPALRTHLDRDVTALATCWEITRRDGTAYRFTDSDEDITVGGVDYLSIGAYSRTAIESTASLAVDNLDIQGIFNELTLPVVDLRAGAFDFAEVKVFACSWMQNQNPGIIKLRKGYFGEITVLPNGTFRAEMRGLMQRLSNDFTQVYSAHCLHDFGDTGCGIITYGPTVVADTSVLARKSYTFFGTGKVNGKRQDIVVPDQTLAELAASGLRNSRYWWDSANTGSNGGAVTATQGGTHREVRGDAGGAVLTQDIPLTGGDMITASLIDAGSVRITLKAFVKGSAGAARVQFNYLTEDRVSLGGYDTGYVTPPDWTEVGVENVVLPEGTRMVRVRFDANHTGDPTDAMMSRLHGWLLDTANAHPDHAYALHDVSYRATGTGTADVTVTRNDAPDGNGFSVGGATFAPSGQNFVVGRIIKVNKPTEVEVTLWTGNAAWVEGWFEIGTVEFRSGKNVGKGMEIKGWIPRAGTNNRTGTLKLFMSLPYLPQIGDTFALIPGCDKTRICCRVMWDNVARMFATPDVPGEDNLFEYPDSKA